jgi:hypothetical protein
MGHEARAVAGHGGRTKAALDARAYGRGPTAGRRPRRDRPGRGDGRPFRTREEFLAFQLDCPHPAAGWVHGRLHDSFVCECCRAVLEDGWPDHHPDISRWVNEGGAAARQEVVT